MANRINYKTQFRSRKHGAKIHLPEGFKIPVSKNSGRVANESMHMKPAAWKIETTPEIAQRPNQANYYKKTFQSALIRRSVWQYMFGGLLRASVGIYSPARYWERAVESALKEALLDDYRESKRLGTYGIYCFKVVRACTIMGRKWHNGQEPKGSVVKKKDYFWLRRGGVFYCRVNRLDSAEGWVDMEIKPIFRKKQDSAILVVRIPWKLFLWLLKDKRIRRLQDGRFYRIKARGSAAEFGAERAKRAAAAGEAQPPVQ